MLDQTQTAVAGLRRVLGVLEIPIGPPEPAHPLPLPDGPLTSASSDVDFTYRSRDGDDDDPPVLLDVTAHDPRRPAGGGGRRDRVGQDDARPAGRPLRRPDRRRRCASAACR